MSQTVLDAYVRYGTRKRADGRIEWKRDPQLVKGFVATDLWRFVRNIKAPILYILGGRSTIVPAETQDELRKTLPNAQLITIPDVGHYPSDEQPDEVVGLVNRFLAGENIGTR
jgi:pimeloyl-ACP methyl ester carboxylesterase